MVDTCVCCGEVVPEGTHVCYACSRGVVNCPDCRNTLCFMATDKFYAGKQVLYSKLYHCDKCHADFETEASVDNTASKLNRKFWG